MLKRQQQTTKRKPRVSVSKWVSDNFVRLWDLLAGTTRFGFIVLHQCILRPEMQSSLACVTRGGGLLAFPPSLNELAALPSGSHHLPVFSLSLALISPMCNESYLKPTKTSSTSLSRVRGGQTGRRRRVCEGGGLGGEGSASPAPLLRSACPVPDPPGIFPFRNSELSRRVSIS